MNKSKFSFRDFGIDDLIFFLTGIAAIVFSILSFFGKIPLDDKETSSIIIGAIGLLMAAAVAQRAKQRSEVVDLREAIGVSESTLIKSSREFGQHLVPNVLRVERYVLDTMLNRAYPSARAQTFFSGPQAEYRKLLFERVTKGEISFKRVEVIFHEQGLEEVIRRLLLHEGHNYFIRYYETPPVAIPLINMMSFDDDAFYLGGFHTKETPGEEYVLNIREPNLAVTLNDYWTTLWSGAVPLNEGRIIDWKEIKVIASKIGVSNDDFDTMVEKLKNEVARDIKQLRK